MNKINYPAIILAITIGIAHFFSQEFSVKKSPHYSYIISFSAGISVTYIFLDLFPNFSEGAAGISRLLFISVLAGFVVFHLVEKYIYKHSSYDKQLKGLAIEDSIISFAYHFVVGIVLVNFVEQGFFEGLLFFVPVFLYTAISTLPVDITKSRSIRLLLAASTVLGVLFVQYVYVGMNQLVYFILLGFIIGALSFTVIRQSLPYGKEGSPIFFTLGVIIYSLLIFIM